MMKEKRGEPVSGLGIHEGGLAGTGSLAEAKIKF